MKALLLRDGDLVVQGGDYATVTGPARVVQDLRLHLGEPLGNDRFHTQFGSTLIDWIGVTLNPAIAQDVENEVRRVVNNYVAVQRDRIEQDALGGGRSRFSTQEVVAEVSAISAKVNFDTVAINITIVQASGDQVILTTAVAA